MGGILLALFAPAWAQPAVHAGPDHNQVRGVRPEAHGQIGGLGAFGIGARLEVPIVPNGFIRGNVRDELTLSPGVEVFFADLYPGYDGSPYFAPLAVADWNFYLGDRWSVFPEAGVAFYIGDHPLRPLTAPVAVAPVVGGGARYHFNDRNSLVMRLTTGVGLQVGATF